MTLINPSVEHRVLRVTELVVQELVLKRMLIFRIMTLTLWSTKSNSIRVEVRIAFIFYIVIKFDK